MALLTEPIEARESRARSRARRQGYVLSKSRVRNPTLDNEGGWQIVDANLNVIEAGEFFDLSLEDVDRWLSE